MYVNSLYLSTHTHTELIPNEKELNCKNPCWSEIMTLNPVTLWRSHITCVKCVHMALEAVHVPDPVLFLSFLEP